MTKPGRQGRLAVLALATGCAGLIVVGVAASAQQVAPEPPSSALGSIPSPIPTGPARAGDGPGTLRSATDPPRPTQRPTRRAITVEPTHRPGHAQPPKHMPRDSKPHNGKPDKQKQHNSAGTKPSKPAVVLPASRPVHLSVPAIGVNTDLTTVGLTSNQAIGVPHGASINEAAWFRQSPTPGQYGPAVIVGHIDTVKGPSVFFRLGALEPGDKILVARADGRTAVFTVDGLAQYPDRANLPIEAIYGGDVSRADLRLLTCTNFDSSIGHYRGNTVVFAHMTGVRPR